MLRQRARRLIQIGRAACTSSGCYFNEHRSLLCPELSALFSAEGRGTSFLRAEPTGSWLSQISTRVIHTSLVHRQPCKSATELSDDQYNYIVNLTLEDLYSKLEILLDEQDITGSDIELSEGVIRIELGKHGTYVLNKQAPNKQLWMSSPVSGPVRYDHQDGRWVYLKDGHDMHHRLTEELSQVFGPVDLDPSQ